ncbi:hypothetical protein JSQ81_04995 [Sporosarcina sp. Marseille-Q4063]|uniref:UPF0158 family protein n=1 Tax=Sporosarcina sp. Marseille-Q4063 TaxID=2810514 RepID=UPI001BAF2A83|nr:UPF0158 family protein [Sporosarcina sp. Marseille-Q4063]QUW22936.1 hypothetical protein JSQ81_04995 [Sporosarcina sp. Marseille-Q4063]
MELIDELVVVFLESDYELSYVLDTKTKEIRLDAPESKTGMSEIDWDDDEAVQFLVRIPQITTDEAYDLMVKFAEMQDSTVTVQLMDVLNRRKPFRSFKDKLGEQGIGDKWYEFENDYAKNRMLEWLKEVQI